MMAKTSLPPGFRFHPTDVELVWYYLKRKIMGKPFRFDAVSEIELYKFAPWDLPDKSCLRSRDLEWYFFCPRDRKYANGSRRNRATDIGYWKMTGRDRPVVHNSRTVGMKKTLIFHLGKPPRGTRTDWVMYEFRLEDEELVNAGYSQDAYVLCKIFQKSGPGPKNGEQYGAPFKEEDWEDDTDIEHAVSYVSFPEPVDSHALLLEPVQQQSVASEVGEPSSSMLDLSEVGEPSSMPDPSYADGILLEQLEEYLYCSPPHLENANVEMLNPEIRHEDVNEMPDGDIEGIYRELDDLSAQLGLEPIDDVHFSDTMYCDYTLHQFAEEHYVELSDLSFPSENNPFELVVPDGTHYPFAIHPSSQGLNSIYVDSFVSASMVNHLLSMGTDITNDQLPSTSKVPSPPSLFSQQKDHVP